MKADLDSEMDCAVRRIRETHLRRLEGLGVPRWAILKLGKRQPPFGLQCIQEAPEGLYEPAEDGPLAMVMPVTQPAPYAGFDYSETIDLIAFRTDAPASWRWRTGDGWALGIEHLDGDAPVELLPHPLAWLAEAGQGLCILDWNLQPQHWRALKNGPPIFTGDDLLRHRLNSTFAAKVPPLVMAPGKAVRHAA